MTTPRPDTRWRWTAALAALTVAAVGWAAAAGPAARSLFVPPPDFKGRHWVQVRDAAEAFRVWSAAGVHGRRLVVFTGRWATVSPDALPGTGSRPPPPGAQVDETGLSLDLVDVDSALLAAARAGIAREVVAVMPDEVYAARREVAAAAKGARLAVGWHDHPYHGFPRRFTRADALPPVDEQVLVLIEPSWFAQAQAPDPRAVLRRAGGRADLGLVALEDPAAAQPERDAARAYAEDIQAVSVGIQEEAP